MLKDWFNWDFSIIGFIEHEIQKHVLLSCINVLWIFWGVLVQLQLSWAHGGVEINFLKLHDTLKINPRIRNYQNTKIQAKHCMKTARKAWKSEIRGFWDVKVGMASKCPQFNSMKLLVHKSFEFSGFCTWPSLAVWHSLARWLGGRISHYFPPFH